MRQLVPPFILERAAAGEHRGSFPAVGVFVDIAGFSSMTDTLMRHGQHGAEVLATIMHAVFGPLVHQVYAQGGYIIGFAGDAFTALFPETTGTAPAAARAVAAAWAMQTQLAAHPSHTTAYGDFPVSAKIGLAAGEVAWGILTSNDQTRAAYYFRGAAVEGSVAAEHQAGPGQIILDGAMVVALGPLVSGETVGAHLRLTGVGAALPEPSPMDLAAPDPAVLGRFFPDALIHQPLRGEFRQVVSLFISLPTVRTQAQLEIFMRTLFELQARYGGLLSQLDFGDKGAHLLLFWGAPEAYENDVERALDFTLDLQGQTSIPINAGLTYRFAHTGLIGAELAEEYTCYGQGVNLAARFMTAAPRGEIWLDEGAAKRAERRFVLDSAGAQAFKGFGEKQQVYVLVERKDAPEAFFEGTLVGRAAELAQLEEFVQPIFAGCYAGALVVWGEPGIGKSRLVHAFQASALFEAQPARWALCQTDEVLRTSLNPLRYWLTRYFGVSAAQAEARNKRSFNRALDELIQATADGDLAQELDRTRSFLGALVGLIWPDSLYEQLDAEGRYENTLLGLIALLKAESRQQPLVLLLEDAHWLDEDSKAFLPRLARSLTADERQQYPIAILTTARVEGTGLPLAGQELFLGGLTRAELAGLAAQALGGPAALALLELLEQRAEGNPFFAEQTLRFLQDAGRLEEHDGMWQIAGSASEAPLPADVSALLVARLDRLAREVKEVVQTAAVLGREFEVRLLARMLQDDQALPDKLEQAEQATIWSALSELRYLFKHALLRDAAYRMQVHTRRQALHALAVEVMERLYADQLGPHYGELAHHTEQAGQVAQARRYLQLAGDAAREAFQSSQAVDYYSRALNLTPEEDAEIRWALLLGREAVYDLQSEHDLQRQDLETLAALADALDAPDKQVLVALRQTKYLFNIVDYPGSAAAAARAVQLARAIGDSVLEARAHITWGQALASQGALQDAQEHLAAALGLARAAGDQAVEADCLVGLGRIVWEQSDATRGQAALEQAMQLFRQVGDRRGEADAFRAQGYFLQNSGRSAEAQRCQTQALVLAQAIGSRWLEAVAIANLGVVAMNLGDLSTAWTNATYFLRVAREIGDRAMEAAALDFMEGVAQLQGHFSAALAYSQQAVAIFREIGEQPRLSETLSYLAMLLLSLGDDITAQTHLVEALAIARASGARSLELVTLLSMGRRALQLANYLSAEANLQQALALAQKQGDQYNEAFAQVYLALAWADQGLHLDEAAGACQAALAVAIELDDRQIRALAHAGLARVALARGDPAAALGPAEEILAYLAGGAALYSIDRSWAMQACYHALRANQDPRAAEFLATEHARLQTIAAEIPDEATRRMFLENVPWNREVVEAWAAQQGS